MADLYEQAEAFRRSLLAKDKQAASALIRSYQTAYERISGDITLVQRRMSDLRARGVPQSEWQYLLLRERRLDLLQQKVGAEIGKFGARAQIIIGGSIESAIASGRTDAYKLMDAALPDGLSVSPAGSPGQPLGPFAPETVRVPTAAVEQLTAITQPGGAIERLLAPLGSQAQEGVRRALIQGITIGENPRRVARRMRSSLGGNLTRSLTIARTEILRAYRESSRLQYAASPDLIDGWTWFSTLDPMRTCASCFAQHGKKYPVTQPMATHPNCRCVMLPATKSWEELGFGDTPESVQITSGEDVFRRLPKEKQALVLGPGKLKAYRGKKIVLDDLVANKTSPTWGRSTSEASLRTALEASRARKSRTAARSPEPSAPVPQQPAFPDLTSTDEVARLLSQVEAEFRSPVVDGQLALTKSMTRRRGFDALGEVIDDAEWDALLARENLQPMFRGITNDRSAVANAAQLRGEQFISGDLFVGRGIYGSGTYTADSTWRLQKLIDEGKSAVDAARTAREEAIVTARVYAGRDGAVLEMALKPGSKIVDHDSPAAQQAFRKWREEAFEAANKAGQETRERMFQYEFTGDFAQWAISQGYDAVKVVSGSGQRESYTVVLNRAAVYVRRRIRTPGDFDR